MRAELTEEISSLEQGEHLCLFYERDPAEQMSALMPFVQEGLTRDEQFIYIADDQTVDQLSQRLENSGVNVDQETGRGRLKLWTRREWREPGELVSSQKAAQVRRFVEEALLQFKGVRFAVEMTWTLGPDIEAGHLEHWEATLNSIFVPGFPGRIICQYNRSRLAPESLVAALHTHPIAILGTNVCPNPFYRAPLILEGAGHEHSHGRNGRVARLEWMISQLKRARAAEQQRQELVRRKRAQRRLGLQYAASRALAESAGVQEAAGKILKIIGSAIGWEAGCFWLREPDGGPMRCMEVWRAPGWEKCEFEKISRASTFERGVGIPGRVWEGGQVIWVPELTEEGNFPRVSGAAKDGLRRGLGFPVMIGREVAGVAEFFTREDLVPDEEVFEIAEGAAAQIGRFVERQRAEAALHSAQQALVRANEQLEARVQERTASLQEAIAQMEEFSYSVSHDLRAPVRAMQGFAKAVLEDYGNRLDEQAIEYLNRVVEAASRMDRLMQDLLVYSRLSRREMKMGTISLDKLLRDITQQYWVLRSPGVRLEVAVDLGLVLGHEPSLHQAITNLLGNAVKFVAPGTAPDIRVWTERDQGRVRLWVQDNGIGIKPKFHHRLFGMFERIHPENGYEGTGIGLAIVRKAVERMGGTVGLESDGINGSRFWIELPEAAEDLRQDGQASAQRERLEDQERRALPKSDDFVPAT